MKYFFAIMCWALCTLTVSAQSTPKIRRLEKERSELRRQISESETLLQSTQHGVKSQLENLALLSNQIDERKKYILVIERDVASVQQEIRRLEVELNGLEQNLQARKKRYEHSLKFMTKRHGIQEKLMFIFSADDLTQMYRRMRYVQEYANFQRLQMAQIEKKQQEVTDKKNALHQTQKDKENLLLQGKVEKSELEGKEKEKQTLLANLKRKQRDIQKELNLKKRNADALNAKIDQLIAYEIEQARKRAEAARKRLEAQRKRKEAERKKQLAQTKQREAEARKKETQERQEKTATVVPEKTVSAPVKAQEVFQADADDRKLSGTFERNKGKLPIPVTGTYAIIGHYGQYQVSGLRHVRLDNKGIDIKAREGAMARTIFDGEVSAIFQYNGLSNVLVRHGKYISVYCNLSSVLVRKGSQLKTRDVIGQVHTDSDGNTVLHFQLRKETIKLNPEVWIHR